MSVCLWNIFQDNVFCKNHPVLHELRLQCHSQVALGNSKIDVKHGDEDHLDDDINSLKILGQNAPVTDFDARLPFGMYAGCCLLLY